MEEGGGIMGAFFVYFSAVFFSSWHIHLFNKDGRNTDYRLLISCQPWKPAMCLTVGQQHRTEGKHKSLSDDLQTGISTLLGAQNSRVLGGVSRPGNWPARWRACPNFPPETGQETDLPGEEHAPASLQRLPWVPASWLKSCPTAQDLGLALHVGPYLSRKIYENVDMWNW